ncbi:hypothetical protein ACHAXR_004464 [Thalassiosira sp. AJA248-18]
MHRPLLFYWIFIYPKHFVTNSIATAPLQSSRADISSKEFQLEELEDKEECETELWLNDDGSVTLGDTNGPKMKDYKGDWHLLETASGDDQPFRMRLTRSYESVGSGTNNLGDVTYDVKREFWGNIEKVGESVSVTGKTHGSTNTDAGNSELGYFTMIDALESEP